MDEVVGNRFDGYPAYYSSVFLLDPLFRFFIYTGITLHVGIKTSRIRGPIFEPFRSVCY